LAGVMKGSIMSTTEGDLGAARRAKRYRSGRRRQLTIVANLGSVPVWT
jgi:hypothetical protein